MKGYKVFNSDWTCRRFQYEVGQTYEMSDDPVCCKKGFHFCKELKDCFSYYEFNPDNKVAEVEALGKIDTETDDIQCCTNKIRIVRELTRKEVLKLVNIGNANTGYWNSGNYNSGNENSGDCNSGSYNSGNENSGSCNSGDYNSSNFNSGDYNNGHSNSGSRNSGDHNSGDKNSGDHNSGDYNSGDHNSGDYNSGAYNSGDWNKTNFSSGCFNTKEVKILMFNKPSDWTLEDWFTSKARDLLSRIQKYVLEWVCSDDMTDQEKEDHPEYKTTGGYLKELDNSECGQIWWNKLTEDERSVITSLPNFDKDIFREITGVDIDKVM